MQNNQNIPIFCISLARATERRAVMRQRLESLNLPYEIIDAVDGRALDESILRPRLRQDIALRYYGCKLTMGEIGCYLSHYNLWERMIKDNIPHALVLEDDADWNTDFAEVINSLQNIPHKWEVILLSVSRKFKINKILCDVGKYKLVRYKTRATSTAGYLINLYAAKKLCEYCYEIREPIDRLYASYWRNGVAFYTLHPALVRQVEESIIGHRAKNTAPLKYRIMASLWRKWNRQCHRFYRWTHPITKEGK